MYVYKRCVFVCVSAGTVVPTWRPEDNLPLFEQDLLLFTAMGQVRWPVISLDSFVSASHLSVCAGAPDTWVYIWFYVASRDLNSSPQA